METVAHWNRPIDRARELADRYSAGEAVTAYVDTDDPESAFLSDRSGPLWYWAGPVLGAAMVLYGVYAVVLGVRGEEAGSVGH